MMNLAHDSRHDTVIDERCPPEPLRLSAGACVQSKSRKVVDRNYSAPINSLNDNGKQDYWAP